MLPRDFYAYYKNPLKVINHSIFPVQNIKRKVFVMPFIFDIANTLIRNLGGYWGDMMAARLREQLSTVYYQHLLTLPQSYYDNELTGTIINRLNRAITELGNFLNMFANNFFQMFLTVFAGLAIILFYSWEIALLMAILYPLFLWITSVNSRKWQVYQDQKNLEYDISCSLQAALMRTIHNERKSLFLAFLSLKPYILPLATDSIARR
jgi:ABC-type multidrug transport system fused ATPase/permease subunit